MAIVEKLTAIADAIRRKTNKTADLTLDQMVEEIDGIGTMGGSGSSVGSGGTASSGGPFCTVSVASDVSNPVESFVNIAASAGISFKDYRESIRLVSQNQASANGITSCSLTMSGCKVGNVLILAYAIRGNGNDPTLTDGWVKLGGGNNVSDPGDSDQRLYFAYKVAASATESVSITQTTTGRIYMVCSEYSEVTNVLMRNDLARIGTSNYTVTGAKSSKDDIMVYAVTSAYYGSGRLQTVTPSDLTKIEGDSSAERLACWFDNGNGTLEHTFYTVTGYTEPRSAILECVQLTQ